MKDEKLMKVAKLLSELASVVNELAEGEEKEVSATPTVAEKPKVPTLEDVRTVLAEISRSGKTAEMKALLGKFGATRLSEVKAEDYTSLLSDAKELKDA